MMKRYKLIGLLVAMVAFCGALQAKPKTYTLASPDGRLVSHIVVGDNCTYDLNYDGRVLMQPSEFWLDTYEWKNGGRHDVEGDLNAYFTTFEDRMPRVGKTKTNKADVTISSPFTRTAKMRDNYNALYLDFVGSWDVEFRAYDNGLAYRLVYSGKDTVEVNSEGVVLNFPTDCEAWVPYVSQYDEKNPDVQFSSSFENLYTHTHLSEMQEGRLAFLPMLVDCGGGMKVCITETHLENYPGLYLKKGSGNTLDGVHAPCPKEVKQGGHNNLQMRVQSRYPYTAKIAGPRTLPWRIMMVSSNDIQLAENNMSYLLAAPSRVNDISWIKPGKVAWDWWNNWNISGVDFKSGINNDTYKYYIDFASKNGIEYVILDEGWAVNMKADLFQVVPEIDLPMLVRYAEARNVGLILWAGYYAFERDMKRVCQHYSDMGISGFKIDFMDRDDQPMTDFYYRAAKICAKYQMVVDFHGAFKPAGLNRTYPNVLNFEGVAGLEQLKWAPATWDQVQYDTELPFIRQTAGPMDYTQGAMHNAAKGCYSPNWSEPMSQGTRCHQLALYIVLESPLNMMCDAPTNYLREKECTQLIASLPTVWDETRVLDGKVGEYIVTARRKGDKWYIGGITNWTARDVEIDLSQFGSLNGYIGYLDGMNADRKGSDYQKMEAQIINQYNTEHYGETIHMAPGGGFVLVLE